MNSILIAKVAGVFSSCFFAGYTWGLSQATIPSVLLAPDEASKANAWRVQYIKGAIAALPTTITNILSWGFLAYNAPSGSLARQLYILTAVSTGFGIAYAWSVLRGVNGALSLKCEKLCQPWTGKFRNPLVYSNHLAWAQNLEKRHSVDELIQIWGRFNTYRAVVLGAGSLLGAYISIAQI